MIIRNMVSARFARITNYKSRITFPPISTTGINASSKYLQIKEMTFSDIR